MLNIVLWIMISVINRKNEDAKSLRALLYIATIIIILSELQLILQK